MQTYCYFVAYEFTLTDGSKSGTGCCFCERKKFDSFNKFLDGCEAELKSKIQTSLHKRGINADVNEISVRYTQFNRIT